MTARVAAKRRVVVGISGASGRAYGIRLLEMLHATPDVETHLVVSRSAQQTMQLETSISIEQVEALADVVHSSVDIGASISSGSHEGHIESMLRVSQAGAIVFPPVPAFYNRPQSVADIVDHSVMRCLDLIDIDCEAAPRWGETSRALLAAATRPIPEISQGTPHE